MATVDSEEVAKCIQLTCSLSEFADAGLLNELSDVVHQIALDPTKDIQDLLLRLGLHNLAMHNGGQTLHRYPRLGENWISNFGEYEIERF